PGATLEGIGLTVNYYLGTFTSLSQLFGVPPISMPTMAGSYTVVASFPGSTDYTTGSALANFSIARATPVLAVSNSGGTFDGSTFPTTDSVAGVIAGVDDTPGPQL